MKLLVVLELIAMAKIQVLLAANCRDGWLAFGESCYLFSKTAMDFVTGEHYCRQHDAHLVHVNDERENNFLKDQMRERILHAWWLGLTDEDIETEWVWYGTDTVAGFNDFKAGESAHGDEDCAAFSGDARTYYLWVDTPCSNAAIRPLCEMQSEEATDRLIG